MVSLLPHLVACVPVSKMGEPPVKASTKVLCKACGVECWITPATLEYVSVNAGGYTTMCVPCAELELAKSGHTLEVHPPTHRQKQEYFEATGEEL